jgi:hypothetical protein
MTDLTQFSDETIRRIADVLRRQTYTPWNSPRPERHQHAKSGPRTVRRARTTTNDDHPTYPTAPANCYVVELGEMVPDGTPEPGQVPFDFEPYDPPQYRLAFVCDDDECSAPYLPEGTLVHIALHHGLWWIHQPQTIDLYEFCLQEDHPGRGEVFDVKLGTWDPSDHSWCFEGDAVKAIDWRYDVPYPDAGARGQGYFLPSDEHGRILIPIDMDCSSPGSCPACSEEE